MSHTRDTLLDMLADAESMAYGPARSRRIEDVVRHADAQGYHDLAFAARMALTQAYEFGGETAKVFVPFSWCLATYDKDPDRYTENDYYHLLWRFKWIVFGMVLFPEIPLVRTHQVLDDMERRYREGGHSLQPVYGLRCRIANHVGDPTAAEWYRKWCTTPRGTFSDCEACDIASKVRYLLTTDGDHDPDVLEITRPVIHDGLGCELQPQSLYGELLLPYLRLGDLDAARDAHRWYRKVRDNREYLATVGQHIEFCALSGNEARGLEILQRHLGWYDQAPDPASLMYACGAAAVLLRRVTAAGQGGATLRRPEHRDRPAGDVEVAALAEEMATRAIELAARFDARNGTDWQSQLVRRQLAAEPIVDHLPLTVTARRPATPPAPPRPTTPEPVDDLADRTPEELLDLAQKYYAEHRVDAAAAAWRRFDEVATDAVDPLLAARRTDARGIQAMLAGNGQAAEAHWRDAAQRFAALGDELRRQSTLGRLGLLLCRDGRGDEGYPLVVASAAYLREHGDPEQRCRAELRLAHAHYATGNLESALACLDRAKAEATTPVQRGDVALGRAACLAAMPDKLTEALEEVTTACEVYRAAGVDADLGRACFLRANLLQQQSDVDGAIAAYQEAIAHPPPEEPVMVGAARANRGALLSAVGRTGEAIEELVEAVAVFTEHGVPGAATARLDLAVALRNAERTVEAAETAEEAVAMLEAAGDSDYLDRGRYLLTQLYRDLAEYDQALPLYDLLVDRLTATGQVAAVGQMHEEAAEVLDALDRDAQAAARFATAAEMFTKAGELAQAVRCRRRQALSLHWAHRSDEGLAVLDEAERATTSLPADDPATRWEQAVIDHTAARILAGLEREAEAVTRAARAVQRFQEAGASTDAARGAVLLGELQLAIDRDAAERTLRAALRDLPAESTIAQRAHHLLATEFGDDTATESKPHD